MSEKLTIKDCYFLFEKYKTPVIVVKHSESVAKVSYLIGKRLISKGVKLDLKNLVYAALLHDLFKIVEIQDYSKHTTPMEVEAKKLVWDTLKKKFEGRTHEEAFFEEFNHKYPKVTSISISHKYSQINQGFNTWEEKVLYYSDKLVEFDKIALLKNRLSDLHKRYESKFPRTKANMEFINEADEKIYSLEEELLKKSGIENDSLIRLNEINFKKLIADEFAGEI